MSNVLNLQAENLVKLYDSSFTKKEATKTGEQLVLNVIENGNVDKLQLMCNLVRLQEVVVSAVSKMREYLPEEKTELFGVSFTPVSGGNVVNYQEDPIWQQLKNDLDQRTEQLKMAQKQPTFDAYGNEVPKVGTTPRKSSVTIKF